MISPTDDFQQIKATLPKLGIGLGLRRSLYTDTLQARQHIDWLEIVPENHMGRGGKAYDMIAEARDHGFPIISHGVALSIGSTDALDEGYIRALQDLFKVAQPAWFSDHLTFSSYDNIHFQDLIPMPFTYEAIDHVVAKIQQLQARFDIPFLIENASYYCAFGQPELSEAQFITEVLERANCGLMLDINNVFVNATNHGYDPVAFLKQLPLDRVVQLHVAGHLERGNLIIDTHGEAIRDEVYDLLATALPMMDVHGILLERDQNFPPFDELLGELRQLRQIDEAATTKTTTPLEVA
ncbi:MAG: DUF692 domain-containing protein [Cyanobacteria bacterium HKST-UBA06]|nr:DUF692 domain-containing protein [Cyanobacteria bacterium HKST-UBA04]MCA9807683.1 DUF692 domain-containing protein [Cyanobacteria bacterium HKST-UBA06]MCA9841455.1 DUF692 domain-containing protein [Cyanobacteria bacterium HKST-UBA03]